MSPWVRLDEAFAEHPKIAALSSDALALWIAGLAYCNRNLTDGFIPSNVGHGQLRYCDDPAPRILELEGQGLWRKTQGGWTVHDFHDYQPTKEKVIAEREAAKNRMRRSREVRPNLDDPVPVTEPVTEEQSQKPAREPRATTARDTVWDFVVELSGEPLPRYRSAHGRVTSDLLELLERNLNGSANHVYLAELRRRHEALAAEYGDSKATARALVNHWDRAGKMADGLMRPAQDKRPTGMADRLMAHSMQLRQQQPHLPELEEA